MHQAHGIGERCVIFLEPQELGYGFGASRRFVEEQILQLFHQLDGLAFTQERRKIGHRV